MVSDHHHTSTQHRQAATEPLTCEHMLVYAVFRTEVINAVVIVHAISRRFDCDRIEVIHVGPHRGTNEVNALAKRFDLIGLLEMHGNETDIEQQWSRIEEVVSKSAEATCGFIRKRKEE